MNTSSSMLTGSKRKIGKLLHTITVGNQLGEGVQWDVQTQLIWWTDIEASCIFSFCLTTQTLNTYPTPYRVACFSLIANQSDNLIVAFDRGIALYHLPTQKLQWLHQPEKYLQGHRFNDGVTDHQGRFWAGTMVENSKLSTELGALYCVDQQQRCYKIINDIEISNGLCFSAYNNTVYHADSPSQRINQYQLAENTLDLTHKTCFVQTQANAFPDGSTIDSANYLWNAQWGASQVICYNPEGKIDQQLTLPVSQPTCVAIGGAHLNLLIITSAKQGLSKQQLQQQPQAGDVFIYQLENITGIEKTRYHNSLPIKF